MVSSIRGSDKSRAFSQVNTSKETLRNNFKSLSSGRAEQAKVASTDVVRTEQGIASNRANKLVKNLKEAASHSTLALRALDRVASDEGTNVVGVKEFTENLAALKENINNALKKLQEHVGQAEVARENLSSASTKLEDIDNALAHAENTGVEITNGGTHAVNAHNGLATNRVIDLLGE